jgi:hypothetical protein
MSVNAVSPSPAAALAGLSQNLIQNPAQQKPAPPLTSQQDSVHLSSEAKAAAGNVANDSNGH